MSQEDLRKTIEENSVTVRVRFHKMGLIRKLKPDQVKAYAEVTGTSPDRLRAAKELVASGQYDKIVRRDGEIYRKLKSRSIPDESLSEGVYRMPIKLLDWFEAFYDDYKTERRELVDLFCASYEQQVLDAESQLGDLFDPTQYPTVDDVRASFWIEKWYLSESSTPDKLEKINPELFGRERKRLLNAMEDSAREMRLAMRRALLELVAHLNEKLKPPPKGGKKKRLHEKTVENLREWLELLESRNITNDADLQKLGDDLKKVMEGADRDSLRDDAAVRDTVQNGLKKAQTSLTAMVKKGPKRKLALID